MKNFILILSCIFILACHSNNNGSNDASATTTVAPAATAAAENASPFGLLLGKATYQETKTKLEGMGDVSLNPHEDNFFGSVDKSVLMQYATGKTIKASGNGLGIDRLEVALFIFDASDKLVSVILKMPKTQFETIGNLIIEKYPNVITKEIPFVGDKFVKIQKGESLIFIEAPHMGFAMTVTYATNASIDAANKALENSEKQTQKKTQNQL